jgi:hypothetical protein
VHQKFTFFGNLMIIDICKDIGVVRGGVGLIRLVARTLELVKSDGWIEELTSQKYRRMKVAVPELL